MIVDNYFTGDDKAHIYTRYRDEDGNLIEHTEHEYEPHFFIPSDTPPYQIKRLKRQFPATRIEQVDATGLDGEALTKVIAHTPYDVTRMREFFNRTYEADVRFIDRYLIDNHSGKMPKWKPRKWWYDIEADTGDDPFTTVIAVIDSDLDTPVVFAWADERTNCPYWYGQSHRPHHAFSRTIRDITYELRLYRSEADLHEGFIEFLQERDPDMMIAHAGTFFDLPHLIDRIDRPERMSPVGFVKRPKKGHRDFKYTDQPIVGRWQFDTAAPAGSGTGFERVWKDSGHGQLPSRKLNDIAETLGLGSKLTEEVEGMDVFNGWYEHWAEFVDYCLLDTHLLRGIDEAHNVTDFYVEMVRLCGVSLESACNVTNFARGLFGQFTDLKAPTRFRGEGNTLKGAKVGLKCVTGLHEGVGIIDYKGLYPSLILGHNLSYETKRDGPGPNIKQLENGTYWDQSKKGLLPQIVEYLFDFRAECKKNMREAESKEERAAWNTTQMAVKRVMASLYGMTAHNGYGWAEADIASTITSEGRRCIELLDYVATANGYECLYGHTDSAFIKVPLEDAEKLAEKITRAVQEKTGNKMLFAELEAWMPYWLLAKKNRYVGKLSWPVEDSGKLKVAGFEMKASNSAPLSKQLQAEMFDLICDGAQEGTVRATVLKHANSIKREPDYTQIAMTTRLGMDLKDYKTLSGASKAADYYNRHIGHDPFKKGDTVKWTYVASVPTHLPSTDIMAFREPSDLEGFTLDTPVLIDKLVKSKIESTFKILDWDIDAATGAPRPKSYY